MRMGGVGPLGGRLRQKVDYNGINQTRLEKEIIGEIDQKKGDFRSHRVSSGIEFLNVRGSVALCNCCSCVGCLALRCECGFRPPVRRHREMLVMIKQPIFSLVLNSAGLSGMLGVVHAVLFWGLV